MFRRSARCADWIYRRPAMQRKRKSQRLRPLLRKHLYETSSLKLSCLNRFGIYWIRDLVGLAYAIVQMSLLRRIPLLSGTSALACQTVHRPHGRYLESSRRRTSMQRRARPAEVDSCDMYSNNAKGAVELQCHRPRRQQLHPVRSLQRMSAAVRPL